MSNPLIETRVLPRDDALLGRNLGHDARSLAYPARRAFSIEEPQQVDHDLYLPILRQRVGSCVLHTMAELISFVRHWETLDDVQHLAWASNPEEMCLDWYRWTTRNDEFDDEWEPNDTGTSGTSGAKCTVHHGYSKGFVHAFSPAEAFGLLNHTPVGFGGWWYSSMDSPSSEGIIRVTPGAYRRGGHEFTWRGQDPARGLIRCRNHWGTGYGIGGEMWLPYEDAERLLGEDGDIVALIPNDQPAPEPEWDLMLIKDLEPWAFQSTWQRVTNPGKAGRAAAASREWINRKRQETKPQ
jgi:hypothetical protein